MENKEASSISTYVEMGALALQSVGLLHNGIKLLSALLDGCNRLERSLAVIEIGLLRPQRLPSAAKLVNVLLEDADPAFDTGLHGADLWESRNKRTGCLTKLRLNPWYGGHVAHVRK